MIEQTKTILLVDDDPDFSEAVSFFLKNNGFQVHRARNGPEALKLAEMQKPDLILMDVMMEERTEGFFTIQQIRRTPALKQIPIFVVSSIYATRADFQIAPESRWLAHDEFFPKPVDLPRLLEKIRARLETPAAREAAK